MENQRLKDEAAATMAQAALEVVESCIHPVCHKDAFEEFLHIAKEGLDAFEVNRIRMEQRLRPLSN